MEGRHPLGNQQIAGHRIQYVVERRGKAVALACFSACANHLADRDRWIGWTQEQAAQRRHLVVQNSRFLILPHEGDHHRNLASRILGQFKKQLSDDWLERFGHPVLLAAYWPAAKAYGNVRRWLQRYLLTSLSPDTEHNPR